MIIDHEDFTSWEQERIIYLQEIAIELGIIPDDADEIAVNRISGNTYLLLENYSFALYLSMTCELIEDDVWILYQNQNTSEGCEDTLTSIGANLLSIEQWIDRTILNKVNE